MHVITIPKSSNTASSAPADTTVTRLLPVCVNVDKGSSIVEKSYNKNTRYIVNARLSTPDSTYGCHNNDTLM